MTAIKRFLEFRIKKKNMFPVNLKSAIKNKKDFPTLTFNMFSLDFVVSNIKY